MFFPLKNFLVLLGRMVYAFCDVFIYVFMKRYICLRTEPQDNNLKKKE